MSWNRVNERSRRSAAEHKNWGSIRMPSPAMLWVKKLNTWQGARRLSMHVDWEDQKHSTRGGTVHSIWISLWPATPYGWWEKSIALVPAMSWNRVNERSRRSAAEHKNWGSIRMPSPAMLWVKKLNTWQGARRLSMHVDWEDQKHSTRGGTVHSIWISLWPATPYGWWEKSVALVPARSWNRINERSRRSAAERKNWGLIRMPSPAMLWVEKLKHLTGSKTSEYACGLRRSKAPNKWRHPP